VYRERIEPDPIRAGDIVKHNCELLPNIPRMIVLSFHPDLGAKCFWFSKNETPQYHYFALNLLRKIDI